MIPCGIRPVKVIKMLITSLLRRIIKTDLHDITEILLKVALSNISTNKTDCHDITEIVLHVAVSEITITPVLLQKTFVLPFMFCLLTFYHLLFHYYVSQLCTYLRLKLTPCLSKGLICSHNNFLTSHGSTSNGRETNFSNILVPNVMFTRFFYTNFTI
jgi:hypothetical protein